MLVGDYQGPAVAPAPEWYVMFSGIEKRTNWSDWFSPKAWQHVCAFFYDPRGCRWVVYDVNRGGIAIVALTSAQFDRWVLEAKRLGARTLRVEWKPRDRLPLQFGMWCVVAVRYAIGCRSLALRPIGLWRDLLREGAVEVFRDDVS